MMKYRNEATASKALCQALRDSGVFVQRIESGTTGRGIPDIWLINDFGVQMWLELKRIHLRYSSYPEYKIPWRPGQQAWMQGITRKGGKAYTIVVYDNAVVVYKMNRTYKDNFASGGVRFECIRDLADEIMEAGYGARQGNAFA